MFIHHVATILLISFSWACHLHRVGTLVMITCDISDVFLELAKLFHYSSKEAVSTVLFALFCVVWIATRYVKSYKTESIQVKRCQGRPSQVWKGFYFKLLMELPKRGPSASSLYWTRNTKLPFRSLQRIILLKDLLSGQWILNIVISLSLIRI